MIQNVRPRPASSSFADRRCRWSREWWVHFLLVAVTLLLVEPRKTIALAQLQPGPAASAPAPAAAKKSAALSARGLENVRAATKLFGYVRFFHPSDQACGVKDWTAVAIDLLEAAEPATDAKDLAGRLSTAIAPMAPSLQIWAGTEEDAPSLPVKPSGATESRWWKHHGAGTVTNSQQTPYSSAIKKSTLAGGVDDAVYASTFTIRPLDGGVMCRLPVVVYADDEGTLPPAPATPDKYAKPPADSAYSADDRSTRLAGVATLWTIMQHFYPYFDVVETDWASALGNALASAATDAGDARHAFTLRALVSKLHDGHGHVYHRNVQAITRLPVELAWAGKDLVVTEAHESVAGGIKIGDTVLAIDGRSVGEWYEDVSRWISAATDGWRRAMALSLITAEASLAAGAPESAPKHATLRLKRPDGTEYELSVARIPAAWEPTTAFESRPEQGAEVSPGIVYFNLNEAPTAAFVKVLPQVKNAKGLIFDLRGYPSDAATYVLRCLAEVPLQSARWNVPFVTKPDGEGWTWDERGRWNLPPQEPRLRQSVVFLTGGGAISYAESVMGIVEAYKLGEIVGSTTAGTNGNVNPIDIPGGYYVTWTGMKVLKHDGSTHHGVGIAPTVFVEATAKGIAEGRDEVLEKGIEVVRARVGSK